MATLRRPEDAEEKSTLIQDESSVQNPAFPKATPPSPARRLANLVRRRPTGRQILIGFALFLVGLYLVGALNKPGASSENSFDVGEPDEDGKETNYLYKEDDGPMTDEAREEIEEEEEGEDLVQGKVASRNKKPSKKKVEDETVDDDTDVEQKLRKETKDSKEHERDDGDGNLDKDGNGDQDEDGEDGENGEDVDPMKDDPKNEVLTLEYFVKQCEEYAANKDKLDPVMKEIAAADCGWGYDYINTPATTKSWKVAIFGPTFKNEILDLSGCPASCPNSPKCKIELHARPSQLNDFDVIVVFQSDANQHVNWIPAKKSNGERNYKVLYWREAVMTSPSLVTQKKFDFEMGVHYFSGINNPIFLRKPGQYLSGAVYPYPPFEFIPVEKRSKFAVSIISHCNANSLRDDYIDKLQAILGTKRVDRFGACSGKRLPGRSINVAFKLMSSYKFYFSFENTIEDGYVTEKLFFVMNVPVVPVYLGALNVPNVTTTPSFIKVSEFSSPKKLADYLLYLDQNPEEYMKYHSWRSDPSSFTKEYLERLRNRVAGPEELAYFRSKGFKRFPRTAQCCRLCDENYVKMAAETRGPESFVNRRMTTKEIKQRYFGNTFP